VEKERDEFSVDSNKHIQIEICKGKEKSIYCY